MRVRTSILAATAIGLGLVAAQSALAQVPNPSVSRPVDPDATASSRVVVAVQPVGRVPYDGVTLPVSSPDGRFIATQHGRTPAWETLLADRGQSVPVGLKISVYRLELPEPPPPSPPPPPAEPKPAEAKARQVSLALVKPDDPLPSGLLLGRSADDTGFLVEAPQADGSRRIGRVRWLSGKLEWLVSDDRVNAHAALAPGARVGAGGAGGGGDQPSLRYAFVRRDPGGGGRAFSLVLRTRDEPGAQSESVYSSPDRSESYLFPFFSPDGRTLAALTVSVDAPADGPLSLVAFDLDAPEPGLHPCGRLDLGRAVSSMHSAFQCIAAMQSPATLPALPEGTASSPSRDLFARGLLFFSPRDAAVVWWLPREDQLLKLAPGSFAAVPFQHADFGFLVAAPGDARPTSPAKRGAGGAGQMPEELWYQTLRIRTTEAGLSEPSVGRQVGVVASRALPRTTNRTGGISLLFSAPRTSDQAAFDVMLLAPAKAE